MFKNKKANFLTFLILVIILIAVGVWIGLALFGSHSADPNSPSGYTAVYMTSGDIYFGKLSWFPRPHIQDAWYLERSTGQDGQPQVGVAPFSSAFWGPVGDIYPNWQNVILYAPIKSGSQLIQAIENPAAAQQLQQQEQQQAEQQQQPTEAPTPSATATEPTNSK